MGKRNILIALISLSVILLIGTSYALLRSVQVGENPYVIELGNLEVKFASNQTENLVIKNALPMSLEDAMKEEDTLSFVVSNTGSIEARYNLYIKETNGNSILKNVLRFAVKKNEADFGEAKILADNKYIDYKALIGSGESINYRLKMWVDEKADATYMNQTFSGKVEIESIQSEGYDDRDDVLNSENVKIIDRLKAKAYNEKEMIAINKDGNKCESLENCDVREYRFSGKDVNNYIYLKDNKSSNELWRIIGIFTDDDTNEEYLKIVRAESLPLNYLSDNYKVNGNTYSLKNSENNLVYWNKLTGTNTDINDFSESGLKYFLNNANDDDNTAGYLNYLAIATKSSLKEDVKYSLGSVNYNENTTKEAFTNEHDINGCIDNVGGSTLTATCQIWNKNKASFKGTVSLMSPSDYGYAADSSYWDTKTLSDYALEEVKNSNWMADINNIWLLNAATTNQNEVVSLNEEGNLSNANVYDNTLGVRPVLSLKYLTNLIDGDGTRENPYIIFE